MVSTSDDAAADAPARQTIEQLVSVGAGDGGSLFGRCLPGRVDRIFGGQVVAQALSAAYTAVPVEFVPNSLHTFFLSSGDPAALVVYSVDVTKSGRALWLVSVEARQGDRALLVGRFSFHRPEPSPTFQVVAPLVKTPSELVPSDYVPPGTDAGIREPFEFRYCDAAPTRDDPAEAVQDVWVRAVSPLPSDRRVHAAVLAFASDLTLTRTAHMPLRRYPSPRLGSSLDHSLWFHKPVQADRWLLFSQRTHTYAGSRALSHGSIFDEAGELVASSAQEALIRLPNMPR